MVEAKTRTYTEFKRVKHNRNLTEPGFSATSGVIICLQQTLTFSTGVKFT